jgi:hypothetical protein
MSRIGAVMNQARQAVQQVEQKVTQEVKQASANTSSLHQAGAPKPGRVTRNATHTFGQADQLTGRNAQSGDSWDERVLSGARTRGFTQVGNHVASAGAEAFAGLEHSRTDTNARNESKSELVRLGVEARGAVFAGAVNGFTAAVQAGAEVKSRAVTREDLGGGQQLKRESTAAGLWGAVASVGAQVGTVTGASVDVFAGARGGAEQRWAVTENGTEKRALGVRGMGMVGVGVKADLEAGYDVENKQARVSGGVGAALGVGGYAGGEVTFGGKDE